MALRYAITSKQVGPDGLTVGYRLSYLDEAGSEVWSQESGRTWPSDATYQQVHADIQAELIGKAPLMAAVALDADLGRTFEVSEGAILAPSTAAVPVEGARAL